MLNFSKIVCSLLLFLFAFSAYSSKSNFGVQIEEFHLDNGMQVILLPNTQFPVVTHMVVYKSGAINDPAGQSGAAHFLEHLMFKETKNLSEGEFSELLAYIGAEENAFTSQDYTAYYQTLPPHRLEMAMTLEADRMKNLVLNQEIIDKERNVILEERTMRIDNNPSAILSEQMRSALFLNHPYKRPVIGWKQEIESLNRNNLWNYYKNNYNPNNAILIIAGKFSIEHAKHLAKDIYGPIEGKKNLINAIPQEPEAIGERSITVSLKEVKKRKWRKFYPALSDIYNDKNENLALLLGSYLLGGSDTSKLYQELVVKRKLATYVGSHYSELSKGPGIFGLFITPEKEVSFLQLERSLDDIIKNFISSEISAEDLRRAKTWLTSQAIYSKDSISRLAFAVADITALDLPYEYLNQWPDKIEAITSEEIIKSLKTVLNSQHSVKGYLLPEFNK